MSSFKIVVLAGKKMSQLNYHININCLIKYSKRYYPTKTIFKPRNTRFVYK